MSLYIEPDNQAVLWKAINSSPLFADFVPHQMSKEEWFKDTICNFNDKNPVVSDQPLLGKLNRATVVKLVFDMKNTKISAAEHMHDLRPKTPEHGLPECQVSSKDEPLQDIDALLQRQIEERKLDIALFPKQLSHGALEQSHIPTNLEKTSALQDDPPPNIMDCIHEMRAEIDSLKRMFAQLQLER